MVLPLTGGGHEGSRARQRTNVNKQKAENGRAVYCYATASGPLQGGEAEREGAHVTMRWWDQTGIEWEKAKARGAETESDSKSGTDTEGEETRDIESRARASSGAEWRGASADEWEVRQTR